MDNFNWIEGFNIKVNTADDEVVISANKQGLMSLASHLVALAKDDTPGAHIHLDEFNSLEENSSQLIIERID